MIAKLLLTEASDALSSADRKELGQLVHQGYWQSRPATPLWDGQEILHRPSVQAIDDGDNAPASWDQDTKPSMPAAPAQGQHGSSPPAPSPLHETASISIGLGNQSGSTSPAANSTAASTAQLEAKMAMLQQRIAAKKAAAKVAAKACKASGDPSAASSSKAPDQAVETQARSMPLQAESVTAGSPDPASTSVKLPKISATVYSSSTILLHSADTNEGNQPASSHSPEQLRVPEQLDGSSSSTILPVSDLGQSQADATANSCGSALPGDTSQPQAVGQDPLVTGAASEDTQLVVVKQHGQIGTGSPANQLPASVSQNAVSGSDQDLITRGQCGGFKTAPPAGSWPSFHHSYAEAQNRQSSQAHLDSSGWMEVLRPHGSPVDAAAISSTGSRLSGNKALQAAINTPLSHQQQGEPGPDSRPRERSLADAAMALTAKRLEVMQSHMPHVLQDKAAMETHNSPKSVEPVNSEQPGSRDFATPMDIDAILPKSCVQSNQIPFGEPPAAAFGHMHCSSFPEQGSCCHALHDSGPSESVISTVSAMLLADDQSDAMDTGDSM